MEQVVLERPFSKNRRRFLLAGIVLLIGGMAVGVFFFFPRPSSNLQELTNQAQSAYAASRFDDALRLAQDVLKTEPEHSLALLLAGRSLVQMNRFDEALSYLDRVPRTDPGVFSQAQISAGELLLLDKRSLSEARRRFEARLKWPPTTRRPTTCWRSSTD